MGKLGLPILEHVVRARLNLLWASETQRSPEETAGHFMFEIDKIVQQWIDDTQRMVAK